MPSARYSPACICAYYSPITAPSQPDHVTLTNQEDTMSIRSVLISAAVALTIAPAIAAAGPAWTPAQWTRDDTLKLCTTTPQEATYCFPVWLVVIDNNVYVRLGNKAAGRVKGNTAGMVLPVEIGGQRFDAVRLIDAPDKVDAVAKAMADKYWSDWYIRWFAHPMTLRLEPASGS